MQEVLSVIYKNLSKISLPVMGPIDVIEILLIAFFAYQFIIWIKYTRAYTLLKGILVMAGFILVAYLLKMNTILWIVRNLANVLIIGLIIIFQPELRKVLEQLGEKKILSALFPFDNGREVKERFTDRTINELVKASFDMASVKTGALIVIEEDILLTEYERTGINVDAILTSQLLINIFEKNTPLHDGAVIIRGDKIAAATCYFPLSASRALNKKYGTRHRAALGISEVSDAFTIVVSEETGNISISVSSVLIENIGIGELRNRLTSVQNDQPAINWFDKFRKGDKADEAAKDSPEVHHQ